MIFFCLNSVLGAHQESQSAVGYARRIKLGVWEDLGAGDAEKGAQHLLCLHPEPEGSQIPEFVNSGGWREVWGLLETSQPVGFGGRAPLG